MSQRLSTCCSSGPVSTPTMLSGNVNNQLPPGTAPAVLPQVDALPGAERKPAARNWNGKRTAGQCGLDMRRHVVGTFGVVLVERIAFGDKALQPALEVALRRRVGVFLDDEARRGVAQKHRA